MAKISDIFNNTDDPEDELPADNESSEQSDANPDQTNPEGDQPSASPAVLDDASRADGGAPEIDTEGASTDLNGVEARVTELETQLASTDDELQRIQNAQEDVETSLDEVTETLDELVGMYDQFMSDTNPFVDNETAVVHGGATDLIQSGPADEQPTTDDDAPSQTAGGDDTAMVETERAADTTDREDEETSQSSSVPASVSAKQADSSDAADNQVDTSDSPGQTSQTATPAGSSTETEPSKQEVIGVDDLVADDEASTADNPEPSISVNEGSQKRNEQVGQKQNGGAAEIPPGTTQNGHHGHDDHSTNRDNEQTGDETDQADTNNRERPSDSAGQPAQQSDVADAVTTTQPAAGAHRRSDRRTAAGDSLIEQIPPGLDAEVLTLEWLSTLTAVAGPAGALRAVRHYEQIGWIGSTARRQIESLLASPSLDVFVDPTDPSEPTAGQHRQSYQYLVVLKTLREA